MRDYDGAKAAALALTRPGNALLDKPAAKVGIDETALRAPRFPAGHVIPCPPGPMTIWPVSTRVNKPDNDDAAILVGEFSSPSVISSLASLHLRCSRAMYHSSVVY
jgi:hypothetical protein